MRASFMNASFYTPMPSGDDANEEALSKARLLRKTDREVRDLSTISLRGALWWFVGVTWPVFVFQTIYATFNVYYNVKYGWNVHNDVLLLSEGYRPFLIAPLQFMSAFLTGLSLNDAVGRFKTALSALLAFRNAVEGLRTSLLASTNDPKLETAVQVYLAMAVVLLTKDIAFFTEDYTHKLRRFVCPEHKESVLFEPEVLWSFSPLHWKFMFHEFLVHSQMSDKHTDDLLKNMSESWDKLEELAKVKSPKTRHQMTRVCLQMFFFVVPLFNEDTITQIMVPLVASLFVAMTSLARELADPWGDDRHSVPFESTMKYLAMPVETHGCTGEAQANHQAIEWMNKGLRTGDWAFEDEKNPLPRQKRNQPNKEQWIDFAGVRSIAEIVNRSDWADFGEFVNQDMEENRQWAKAQKMCAQTMCCRSGVPDNMADYVCDHVSSTRPDN